MAFNSVFIYKGQVFKTGDQITCVISGQLIRDAKIYITNQEEGETADGAIGYICQNKINGNTAPNTFGYRYGWAFAMVYNTLTDHVQDLKKSQHRLF